MPDSNDIVFDQQVFDVTGVFDAVLGLFGNNTLTAADIIAWFSNFWTIFVSVSFLLAALFLFGYIYAAIRFNQLAAVEGERIKAMENLWQELYGNGKQSTRLQDIQQHIMSNNPNDWKLAIIEADIELEKAMEAAGYRGNTLGEMLKDARAGSLKTINDAWDAHLVRNKIAHQGADFILTKKIAQDTITQYKRVFEELDHA